LKTKRFQRSNFICKFTIEYMTINKFEVASIIYFSNAPLLPPNQTCRAFGGKVSYKSCVALKIETHLHANYFLLKNLCVFITGAICINCCQMVFHFENSKFKFKKIFRISCAKMYSNQFSQFNQIVQIGAKYYKFWYPSKICINTKAIFI